MPADELLDPNPTPRRALGPALMVAAILPGALLATCVVYLFAIAHKGLRALLSQEKP